MNSVLLFVSPILYTIMAVEGLRDSFPDKTDSAFNKECLVYHNSVRKDHKAGPLTINNKLIEYAKKRLATMTQYNGLSYGHKGLDPEYGENIYRALGKIGKLNCGNAIRNWYNEIKDYNFEKGVFSHETGHFTQLLWKDTKEVGCARSVKVIKKNRFEIYMVCTYQTYGNVRTEFTTNVLASNDNTNTVLANADRAYKGGGVTNAVKNFANLGNPKKKSTKRATQKPTKRSAKRATRRATRRPNRRTTTRSRRGFEFGKWFNRRKNKNSEDSDIYLKQSNDDSLSPSNANNAGTNYFNNYVDYIMDKYKKRPKNIKNFSILGSVEGLFARNGSKSDEAEEREEEEKDTPLHRDAKGAFLDLWGKVITNLNELKRMLTF